MSAAGVHGKVPSRGDFVRRALPRAFVEPWDLWLQAAIVRSRERLGEEWLPVYLTSPVWRFALAPGACGEAAVAGVLLPSADRIGRCFPLTLAVPLAGRPSPLAVAARATPWFDRAEDLARRALEDHLDLDAFAADLAALGAPAVPSAALDVPGELARGWRVGLADGGAAEPVAIAAVAAALVERAAAPASAWWTRGSERVTPSLLLCAGLPRAEGFAALLDGRWPRWGWGELRETAT